MFWILIVLVALVVAFAAILPTDTFVTTFNAQTMAGDASTLLVLAAGATIVIIAGGLDLSIGSVMTFSAVAATLLMKEVSGARPTTSWKRPWWACSRGSAAARPGARSTGG